MARRQSKVVSEIRPFAPPKRAGRPRALSAGEWTDAALWMMRDGVASVSVESLARQLGVTKGSFYWHYKDRGALIAAALLRWEELATDAVITQLAAYADPRERLRQLFAASMMSPEEHLAVELAIVAAAEDPVVRASVSRVSRRRLEYVVGLYRAMGFGSAEAKSRGTLAYAAYVGLLSILRATPDVLASRAAKAAYQRQALAALVPA